MVEIHTIYSAFSFDKEIYFKREIWFIFIKTGEQNERIKKCSEAEIHRFITK